MNVSWLWTFICLLLTHYVFAQIHYEVDVSRGRSALSSDLGQGFTDSLESSILSEREKRKEAIEYVFSKLFFEWNITFRKEGQGLSSNGTAALIAEEHELAAHLHQVLGVADKLVHIARVCNKRIYIGSSNVTGPKSSCQMLAPELRQGSSLSFLTSLLRNYPRGPTSREALVAWAAAATAFLEGHYRLQVQQRNMTQQVADTAADAAAIHAATRAEANVARKAAMAKRKKGDLVDVDGSGRDVRTPAGGSEDDSSGTDFDDYVGELGSRRKLDVAEPGGSRNSLAPGGGGDGDDRDSDYSSDVDFDNGDVDDDLLENPGAPSIPVNFTGVQYGSLPLVRRVLLAQLLLGWMGVIRHNAKHSADVSKIADEDLVRVVTMLYKIHVESVAQRAIMEYFHISKAGGTSWTAAATASGCELPRANAARYRAFDDDCRWINGSLLKELGVNLHRTRTMQVCSRFDVTERQTDIRSCMSRLHHALNRGFQYISNEYTLHGGLRGMNHTQLCPEFVNVISISIREPLQRLASNIKYMLVRLRSTLFRRGTAAKLFPKLFCNASVATWETYTPPVADNYNIRTMVGERAFHTPLYGIGEAHEAVAKKLLIQYDLVLDLNSGDNVADLIMREGLGWSKTLAEVRIWTVEALAKKTGMNLDADCPVGDLSPLMSRQVYDKRWYSFGRMLSRLDQLFLAAAEHLGLKPWPEDWARVAWGNGTTAMTAASNDAPNPADLPPSERTLTSRCGLLGATQVLRHGLET
ncbi:hypothetical protein VaNZ11_002314 [Volvox africanus]|uniref:Uncharacterized protein n=1 Tax=Volvox africanus TaxID=51714 RepID=A0ABQ5RRL2_9CHLO|nr:hypothetical protein VaNZ11_002314 [Volvox africanus]